MMDIFDRARRALGDLAQSASEQARLLKLQSQMGEIESQLDGQLVEVARRARQLWQRREFSDSDFEILMKRVDELEAELDRLRQEANDLRQAMQSEQPPSSSPQE